MTKPEETEAVVTKHPERIPSALRGRIRALAIAGVSLATIAAVGTAWATGSSAATGRYVTATAATGSVTQSYLTTGAITRTNNVEATFAVGGTVKSVKVAIGDAVTQGQVLATIDTTALKLALLNAETNRAQAKATLYAAENPASSSSSSAKSVSSAGGAAAASGGTGTGTGASTGTGTGTGGRGPAPPGPRASRQRTPPNC